MSKNRFLPFLSEKIPEQSTIYANGIFADTGLPLCEMNISTGVRIAKNSLVSEDEKFWAKQKFQSASEDYFGVIGGVNPDELSEAGWGIIFKAGDSGELENALEPLIRHRNEQAGDMFKIFKDWDGYQEGEECKDWLARHGTSVMAVDPSKGVPYYILLVGSPEEIPFEFQYQLDIYWAVGRICFDHVDLYRRYAESVVAYETSQSVSSKKNAVIFAPRHEFDRATQMFVDHVANPLANGDDTHLPLGKKFGFNLRSHIGESATKETLAELLAGNSESGPLSFLLTGSHGMGFRPDDPRLFETQGALVCQDWQGWGKINRNDWFAAADLPKDANFHGLIHFFFACYGAGCPEFDDFYKHHDMSPPKIAPNAMVAKLPREMLSHENGGALAAVGHVDRAWNLSFYTARSGPQIQGFRDVMNRILIGERIGKATDQFDVRRAAISYDLADMYRDLEYRKQIPDREVLETWIARNDARNYVILGDPAVRLRVEDMQSEDQAHSDHPAVSISIASNASDESGGQDQKAAKYTPPSGKTEASKKNMIDHDERINSLTNNERKEKSVAFDLGARPETPMFDEELHAEWKAHVKQAYKRNEEMFDRVLESFMRPYWTVVWMHRVLFFVGILGFVSAAVLGAWKGIEFSALFGGLSAIAFLGFFISRPLMSLERNLQFVTWLGLIFNTYWMRLTNCLNEKDADKLIATLQNDAGTEIQTLIKIHQSSGKKATPNVPKQ